MKSDTRLVKNIQHTHKRTADLCCKADSLTFTAAECSRTSRKCKVAKTYAFEKVKSFVNFFDNFSTDNLLFFRELELTHEVKCVNNRHFAEIGNVKSADCYRKAFG